MPRDDFADKALTPLPGIDPGEPLEKVNGWKVVGPGLVVAATGVGAADLVATLTAGSRFGYGLLWAVVLGTVLKIILVEGAGRYSLATGRTIFEGWRSLGRWTTVYFGPYIIIWGFVYGATAMSSAALPLAALFPVLPLWAWAVFMGLLGFFMVWFGRYALVERLAALMVGIMFVVVVGLAIIAVPNVPDMITGFVPVIPEGGLVYTLALAGGIGGTITLAAYGYWLREKGWYRPRWMRVMQLDNAAAYTVTGIFVVAMLIVGVEVLYSAGYAISAGDEGLLELGEILKDRYGDVIGTAFLVGFWAASFSSLVGVWSGVSLMFADFWGNIRGKHSGHPDTVTGGKYFRFYLLWLTFPPMLLFMLGRPVFLILLYGVLGALFMPFLALTLIWLLNTRRTPERWRNGVFTNVMLAVCVVLFTVLGLYQAWDTLQDVIVWFQG
ncbi:MULTISPECIES: Nramp family divalent metal transporter [Kocuria]|uniref:Iron transporter n=1 Tax=Kocuria rosea subsp. polaris TaxID=136273 RepID=A0A0W8IMB7_KOCRO|nr:Nramp family divalent metal transporter [Kocuria polaris]KUG61263.1 iron transporter [Kocuria polaris]